MLSSQIQVHLVRTCGRRPSWWAWLEVSRPRPETPTLKLPSVDSQM
jgi:hypothetical protein